MRQEILIALLLLAMAFESKMLRLETEATDAEMATKSETETETETAVPTKYDPKTLAMLKKIKRQHKAPDKDGSYTTTHTTTTPNGDTVVYQVTSEQSTETKELPHSCPAPPPCPKSSACLKLKCPAPTPCPAPPVVPVYVREVDDHVDVVTPMEKAKVKVQVKEITMKYAKYIEAFTTVYECTPPSGQPFRIRMFHESNKPSPNAVEKTFTLSTNEVITGIERRKSEFMTSVTVTTNLGRTMKWGTNEGSIYSPVRMGNQHMIASWGKLADYVVHYGLYYR